MAESVDETIDRKKRLLRKQLTEYRKTLSEEEYRQRSTQITNAALSHPLLLEARCVHVYWPMTHRREIDTRPLIHALDTRGVRIALPVVESFERHGRAPARMSHHAWMRGAPMRINRWGVHEPEPQVPVPPAEIDVIIVPALAVDREGFRLGYGQGFYDEFLALAARPSIALIYEACLLDAIPREAHDVPVDLIVTESGARYAHRS